MHGFFVALQRQRWDDHRYYHHSRVNQSLHLVSALSFLAMYALLLFDPTVAVMLGWLVAMTTRQAGHFFFEPKDYDAINQATHDYKESIKVGYNLRRKVVLLAIWALCPLLLWLDPALGGWLEPARDGAGFVTNTAWLWLVVGIGGVIFRTVHLFFLADVQTGLVWMTKILTDPFHDVALYYRAPLQLLRGEFFDPMLDVRGRQ